MTQALYQRLKELDAVSFQRLCFQIIKARHPEAEIMYVGGKAGDEGLDLFLGNLSLGSTVWQCKAFPDGVKNSQRQQVRNSLRAALKSSSPRRWILCLSTDLDAKAHRWFQRLQTSYASIVSIGLFQASDIVSELVHRSSIRNAFFPGASLNVQEIRDLLLSRDGASVVSLRARTEDDAAALIAKLKAEDARFDYAVRLAPEAADQALRPSFGTVASVSHSGSVIEAFPRDFSALRLSPPRLRLKGMSDGAHKLKEFLRTGRRQILRSSEVEIVESTFPLFSQFRETVKGQDLTFEIATKSSSPIPIRMKIGNKADFQLYDNAELHVMRAGSEEIEFSIRAAHLPFQIKFEIFNRSAESSGTTTFTHSVPGFLVQEVLKYLRAVRALRGTNPIIEITSLTDGSRLLRVSPEADASPFTSDLYDLAVDLATISDSFDVPIKFPHALVPDEANLIHIIAAIVRKEGLQAERISGELVRTGEWGESEERELRAGVSLQFDNPQQEFVILGTRISVGPTRATIERAEILDCDRVLERFRKLKIGDSIHVEFEARSPVFIEGVSPTTS
jgi:hypothetical protein